MKRVQGLLCAIPLTLVGCGGGDTPASLPEAARDSIRESNPSLVWAALPSTWQQQCDDLLRAYADLLPPDVYDQCMATLSKAVAVAKEKQQFFLQSKAIEEVVESGGPAAHELFTTAFPAYISMLEAVTQSDLRSVESLKQTTVAALLHQIGPRLFDATMGIIDSVAQLPGSDGREATQVVEIVDMLKNARVTVVSESGSEAVVSIEVAGLPGGGGVAEFLNAIPMQQVEGKWVPKAFAMAWPAMIAQGRFRLGELTAEIGPASEAGQQMRTMTTMLLAAVNTAIDMLATVTTQAEFDQTIAGLQAMLP